MGKENKKGFVSIAIIIQIVLCLLLGVLGCPVIKNPSIKESEFKSLCRIEWYGCVVFESYEDLITTLLIQHDPNTCVAPDLLCIWLTYDTNGTIEMEVVRFNTVNDIPRTSLNDEYGNCIIQYLNEDL